MSVLVKAMLFSSLTGELQITVIKLRSRRVVSRSMREGLEDGAGTATEWGKQAGDIAVKKGGCST
jgi:hypothetical protein